MSDSNVWFCLPASRRRRPSELFTESPVSQQLVVEPRERKRGGKTDERAIGRGRNFARERACFRSCVTTLANTLGLDREQVDTFREEIARRTDTSRARSSYPQHPAVAAAAAVAAVERDEAEHARNSAPFTPSVRPLSLLPMGCSHPLAHPPSSSLRRSHSPPRLSSLRSTSAVAASTLHSSFRAEFAPPSTEFDFTLYCLLGSVLIPPSRK